MSELEDLRRQNRALDEQIKTLVRVEASLHKSQNEVDRQIVRVELLSRFALRWTSRSTVHEILEATLELFQRLFSCEWLTVLASDVDPVSEHPAGVPVLIRPAADWAPLAEALSEIAGPVVASR
jgi:hypothetical protein